MSSEVGVVLMRALKGLLRPMLLQGVAMTAPLTWSWRAQGSLVVLMYHRVLPTGSPELCTEQPAMYVSPETLDLHLSEIKRYFELVHLDDWLRRMRQGASLPRLACAITFDDGWQDNFDFALPVLRKHAAPATIFLVSTYISGEQRFWPNRLMSLVHRSFVAPQSVEFPLPLSSLVGPALAVARIRGELNPEDIDGVVQKAKSLPESIIRELVAQTEKTCKHTPEPRQILSGEEVARMAATGLVRFGCHTATHLRIDGGESPEQLEREIVLSRRRVQELCSQSVDLFCYPNGDTSPDAIELVRQHYLGAVTARRGWHSAGGDPYLIRRIPLYEDKSATKVAFLARLSAWV